MLFSFSSTVGRVNSNGCLTGDGSEDDSSRIPVPFLSLDTKLGQSDPWRR